jgi:NAD-dependent SIR2 family protein deacetylase
VQRSQARVSHGKRALKIGRLRPDVRLYGEPHPDEGKIVGAVNKILAKGPDIVLVVGTQLRVPGALSIAKSFCYAARDKGGVTVWISKEEPTSKLRPLFDYIFKGDCDAVTWSSVRIHSRPTPA